MTELVLLPVGPEHLLALIESEERFTESFGIAPAEGLRGFFVSDYVSALWLEELARASAADAWVHGFVLLHQAEQVIVGTVAFKGAPDAEGVVEMGYGVVSAFEGRGLATEAARAGLEFAMADESVRCVRAHTLPTRNASTRVLEKCGFQYIGDIVDPEDGPVWRWEKQRGARVS